MESIRRIIIDVDVGTDDFLAIILFLKAQKFKYVKIDGIICTCGNTTMENVTNNVVKILEIAEQTNIPVYKGATDPLIPIKEQLPKFHGANGLGDIELGSEPNLNIVKDVPAAVAINELVLKYPKEISLICLAPLTNIALALKLYKDFANNVKDVWIMGGSYTAQGNITETAEHNFYFDPEAAFIVLESFKCPIYVLPWEPCLNLGIDFEWRYETFGIIKNDLISLLNRVERIVYEPPASSCWLPCDAYLAAAYLNRDLIVKTSPHWATIELHGQLTRGQVVLDHLKKKEPNIIVIEQINLESFKEMLLDLGV